MHKKEDRKRDREIAIKIRFESPSHVKNLQIGNATLVTTMVVLGKASSRGRVVKAKDS
jgi:hypothetical protein